jgi:hypothetical protein
MGHVNRQLAKFGDDGVRFLGRGIFFAEQAQRDDKNRQPELAKDFED